MLMVVGHISQQRRGHYCCVPKPPASVDKGQTAVVSDSRILATLSFYKQETMDLLGVILTFHPCIMAQDDQIISIDMLLCTDDNTLLAMQCGIDFSTLVYTEGL